MHTLEGLKKLFHLYLQLPYLVAIAPHACRYKERLFNFTPHYAWASIVHVTLK